MRARSDVGPGRAAGPAALHAGGPGCAVLPCPAHGWLWKSAAQAGGRRAERSRGAAPARRPLRPCAHLLREALRRPLQQRVQVAHRADALPPGHSHADLLDAQQVAQRAGAQARGAVRDAPLACGARRRPELRRPCAQRSAAVRRAGARRAACMRAPRRRSDHADSMPRTEGAPSVSSAGAGGRRRGAAARAGDAPGSRAWAASRAPRTGLPQPQAAQQQRGHAAGQQGLQPLLHLRLERVCGGRVQHRVRPDRALGAVQRHRPGLGLQAGAACGPRASAPRRERFQRRDGGPAR